MSSTTQAPVGIQFTLQRSTSSQPKIEEFTAFFAVTEYKNLRAAVEQAIRELGIPAKQTFKGDAGKQLKDQLVGLLRNDPIFNGGGHKREGDNSWMLHPQWQKNATAALNALVMRWV